MNAKAAAPQSEPRYLLGLGTGAEVPALAGADCGLLQATDSYSALEPHATVAEYSPGLTVFDDAALPLTFFRAANNIVGVDARKQDSIVVKSTVHGHSVL